MPRGNSGDQIFYGGDLESLESSASHAAHAAEEASDQLVWKDIEHIFENCYCEGSGAEVHPRGVGIYDDLSLPIYYGFGEGPEGQSMEVHIAASEKKPLLALDVCDNGGNADRRLYSGESLSHLVATGKRQAIEWGNEECFAASAQEVKDAIKELVDQIDMWR